tara:strand:+ start:322 stop:579 length:258 start_codon:yes stop_codon:yes gene_type:complete
MSRQTIKNLNPEAIFLDNAFDDAIVGIGSNALGDVVAIYSQKDCMDIISSDGVANSDARMLMCTFIESTTGKYAPMFLTEIWEIS